MSITYTRVTITEARAGDEGYQAGEWTRIASVTLSASGNVATIRWEGGGTHTFPVSHGGTYRRAVAEPEARTSTCRGCGGALTWAGHYWTHDATGARICHAEAEPGGTYPDGVDYAAEADYRAHSSSITGIYEAP